MMKGKTVLITGANSGIGKETALALASQQATLIMVCRNKKRGEAAAAEFREKGGSTSVEFMLADLSSQADVRRLAEEFLASHDRLDVLVNNAGGIFPRGAKTRGGLELTLAVNHLGHFLLTSLLLDLLKKSAPSRIVNVSSAAHFFGKMDLSNLHGEHYAGGFKAYCDSKLANVLFTTQLARRLEGSGVTANSLHPGGVRTRFGQSGSRMARLMMIVFRPFMISPKKGAQTSIYLASSPEVETFSGKYFARKKAVSPSKLAKDDDLAERLWDMSARLTGVDEGSI